MQIYTDWANHYLAKSGHKRLIKDLQQDVTDGVLLAQIIQVVGKSRFYAGVDELQGRFRGVESGNGMERCNLYEKCNISATCVENLFDCFVLRECGYQLVFC